MSSMNSEVHIAIIGMSYRFSGGATNPEKLWKLLAEGRSGWSEIPSSRFNLDGVWHPFFEKLNNVSLIATRKPQDYSMLMVIDECKGRAFPRRGCRPV